MSQHPTVINRIKDLFPPLTTRPARGSPVQTSLEGRDLPRRVEPRLQLLPDSQHGGCALLRWVKAGTASEQAKQQLPR